MKKIKITKEQYNKIAKYLTENVKIPTVPNFGKKVDKSFKQAFGGNLKESAEMDSKLKYETAELIKYLYRKSEDLSPFWAENNLTYDDICEALESKGMIIKKDGKYELSKSLGSAEEAKQALQEGLRDMLGGEVEQTQEIDENINGGNFKTLFFNSESAILEDGQGNYYFYEYFYDKEAIESEIEAPIIGGEKNREYAGRNEFGDAEYDDEIDYEYGEKEITAEDIDKYVNNNLDKLSIGSGEDGMNDGESIVKIDDELKNSLIKIYSNDKKFSNEIAQLNIGLNEGDYDYDYIKSKISDPFKKEPKTSELSPEEMKARLAAIRAKSQAQDIERFKQRDTQNAIDSADAEDKLRTRTIPVEPKKPIGQYNMFGGVDEMTSTGSVGGGFEPPIGYTKRKLKESFELGKNYTHFAIFKSDGKIATGWDYSSLYDKYEKAYDDVSIKEYAREDIMNDFPDNKVSDFKIVTRKYLDKKNINPSDTNNWYKPNVNETLDVSGAGNFQYDTPGGLTMDLGKNNPKTKAEKTPQWAGGEFVEQPNCSKLNNNKEAQNGGCNTGASSLKTKKAKGSINAPSLGEVYKVVAEKTGRTIEEVKAIIESKKNKG